MHQTTQISGTALKLFASFTENDVKYCHWKSNEHLLEGLVGVTDLDILVEESKAEVAEHLLIKNNFKRFQSVSPYPSIEDYLGMDDETGVMLHIHLHFKLILGEKHLKGYHLPWEEEVLSSAILDNEFKVFRANPNIELIILLVRLMLKIKPRDYLLEVLGVKYFDKYILKEYQWLLKRIDNEVFYSYAQVYLGDNVLPLLTEILALDQPSIKHLGALRKISKSSLEKYRLYPAMQAMYLQTVGEIMWLYRGISRRYFKTKTPKKRIDPFGGLVVAFVGADGSGKSTMLKEVKQWLSWKLDVQSVYFGSGDGESSLIRRPMKLVLDIYTGLKQSKKQKTHSSTATRRKVPGKLRKFAIVPWSISLALEKKKKMKMVARLKKAKMIVITDRFPQTTILGYSDGPLLNQKSGALKYLSKWEFDIYNTSNVFPPDLLIKLDVSPEVAMKRKPWDITLEDSKKRSGAIRQIHYDGSEEIIVNADEELNYVLLSVKKAIWKKLINNQSK